MRIISVVLNHLNNDSRVLKIGRHLRDAGFSVSFCALGNYPANKPTIKYFHETLNGFPVLRMSWVIMEKGYIVDKKLNNSLFSQLFKLTQLKTEFQMTKRLFNILRSQKTDIFYCNDCNTLTAGYFAAKRNRAKLIYDTHELWAERYNSKSNLYMKVRRIIEYILEAFFIRRCDLVITVSDGIADELVKRYRIIRPLVIRNLDEKKHIPSNKKRMQIREELHIPTDSILLVYQGLLSDGRGIPELVDSMELLADNYHLILMGEGMSKHTDKMIHHNPRIHYIGMVDEDKLFQYSASADIGVIPYHTENIYNYFVTFPNKFSQFLNAGLGVVFYDSLESRKIINNCSCGMILEDITPEYIASAVFKISEDRALQSIRHNARRCFLDHYNWKIERDKLIAGIRQL